MSGTRGVLYTLGLTVALAAGCTSADTFTALLLQSDAKGDDRVIAASVDSVSESVSASLSQLGMAAKMSRRGEAVLIASSLTMALAVHAAQTHDRKQLTWFLVGTMLLGAVLLGIKGIEYYT